MQHKRELNTVAAAAAASSDNVDSRSDQPDPRPEEIERDSVLYWMPGLQRLRHNVETGYREEG